MEILVFAGLMIVLLWFMSSRTRKQQQAARQFLDNLEPGQEVMTIGRMYGTVVEVDGDRVTLELLDGGTGQWDKSGIAKLVEPPVELDDDEYDDDEYEDDEDWEDEPEDDTASPPKASDEDTPRS